MRWKSLAAGAAALVAVLAWAAPGKAGDLVRLVGKGGADTVSLVGHGDVDTVPINGWRYWGGGRSFYRGVYRPFYGRYYRPYYRPFARRPFFYAPYRSSFYSYSYPGSYFYPRVYGARPWLDFGLSFIPSYSSPPVCCPPVYSPPPCDVCPSIGSLGTQGSTPYLSAQPRIEVIAPPSGLEAAPAPIPVPKGGTYPYDGGPANPVPMPGTVPEGANSPINGKIASLSVKATRYTYPAFGDKPVRMAPPAEDNIVTVKAKVIQKDR